jgi:hypothetical protein
MPLRRRAPSFRDRIRAVPRAIGCGLPAGFAGTAAMTLSSTIEMKLRRRPPSSAPADAAARVLGVEPQDERSRKRFATAVHWSYGTGWGAARGLLAAAGVTGARGTVAHLGVVWGSELVMLPALGVAPPFWAWGAKEVAIDLLHHVVYAAATGAAYERCDG